MNKEQRRAYFAKKFILSDCTSIMDYYVRPSYKKVAIEQGVKKRMLARNGKRYRVLNGNTFCFTCAYVYPKDDTWILVVETAYNHRELELLPQEVDLLCLQEGQKTDKHTLKDLVVSMLKG